MAQSNTIRLVDLAKNRPFKFRLGDVDKIAAALTQDLDVSRITKLRFEGMLTPSGKHDWILTADLGASVTMACVVTGDPVVVRIDTHIKRTYAAKAFDNVSPDGETEMPEDDSIDPLPEMLDLADVVGESLSLALPDYPRSKGAELDQATFAAKGIVPLTDEAAKPFAGLASLRDQMTKKDG